MIGAGRIMVWTCSTATGTQGLNTVPCRNTHYPSMSLGFYVIDQQIVVNNYEDFAVQNMKSLVQLVPLLRYS